MKTCKVQRIQAVLWGALRAYGQIWKEAQAVHCTWVEVCCLLRATSIGLSDVLFLYKQGDRQLLHPRHKPKGCLSSARLQGSRSKWLWYEGGGIPLEICAVTWCLELQRPGNNALHHRRMPDTAATCPNPMPAFDLFQHAESPTASMAVLMMDGISRFLCCGRAWQDIISCIHMLLRMSQCCALTHSGCLNVAR